MSASLLVPLALVGVVQLGLVVVFLAGGLIQWIARLRAPERQVSRRHRDRLANRAAQQRFLHRAGW